MEKDSKKRKAEDFSERIEEYRKNFGVIEPNKELKVLHPTAQISEEKIREEYKDRRLLAPCGLYCGVCGVYIATRDRNEKFKVILGKLYGTKPEETECKGCMQGDSPELIYSYCKVCPMRDCVKGKGFYSCHQCSDYPCKFMENFPIPVGKKVMKRAIPEWRALCTERGTEEGNFAFAKAQFDRYRCPTCGNPLFRGAQRCNKCKISTDVD